MTKEPKPEPLGVNERLREFNLKVRFDGHQKGYSKEETIRLIQEAEAALREKMGCEHPKACFYEVGKWHPNIGGTDAPESRCTACKLQAQAVKEAVEKARRETLEEVDRVALMSMSLYDSPDQIKVCKSISNAIRRLMSGNTEGQGD